MNKARRLLTYLVKFFIIFFFLLKLPLIAGFTTRNLAIIIAIFIILLRKEKLYYLWKILDRKKIGRVIFLFLICTFIAFFNIPIYKHNSTQYLEPWFFLYEFIHVVLFSVFLIIIFDDIVDFAKVYVGIFILQAATVFLAVVNTGFRIFLYEHFYVGDERFENTVLLGTRIMGIGIYASSGSIVCCTVCLLLVYLALKEKINIILFSLLYTLMLIMTMFIGRTGALLELLLLLYFAILVRFNLKKIVILIIPYIIIPIILLFLLNNMDSGGSETLFEWIMGFIDRDYMVEVADIVAVKYPPFDIHMIFGTGVLRGATDYGTTVWSDSGYIKTYCAIGIVGATLYYLAYFILFRAPLVQNKKNRINYFFYFIILSSFVIEYKEPYMHRCIFNWAIMTLLLFEAKEEYKDKLSIFV